MAIPRLQLFEFEDLSWFPQSIKDLATDYLLFIETRFALHKPVVPLLRDALKKSKAVCVVDLCAGAGGFILALYEGLAESGDAVPFVLTDKYPNLAAFQRLASSHSEAISYIPDSCDASDMPKGIEGFRTIFNGFHHFPPTAARSLLESAVRAGQPIGVFEIPERKIANMLSLCLTPLFVALATPFIRPFRWQRLFWTYLVPVVPITCWWDGLISQWRAYTVSEMLAMTQDLQTYEWNAGGAEVNGGLGQLTYLIGIPKAPGPKPQPSEDSR